MCQGISRNDWGDGKVLRNPDDIEIFQHLLRCISMIVPLYVKLSISAILIASGSGFLPVHNSTARAP